MVIHAKLDCFSSRRNLVLVNLFFVFVGITEIRQIEAATCLLTNNQKGQCVKYEDCPSAIVLAQKGVTPGYCNLEEDIVCCTDIARETGGSRNNKRNFAQTSSDLPDDWYSRRKHKNTQEYYEDPNNQRRKHSVGKPVGNSNENNPSRRKNIYDSDEPYKFEKPDNFYPDASKPSRRPSGSHSTDQTDNDYFVPPGLAKKKSWREEKTTENDYYYEQVTKKPSRGPNRKGPSRHNDNTNYETSNPKRKNEDNPRNEWSSQGGRRTTENYDWYDNQNGYDNNYSARRTTTKRNIGTQDTTTQRNNYFGNGPANNEDEYFGVKPGRHPHRTSTEGSYNRPKPQQGFRPQDNKRPKPQQGYRPEDNRPNYQQGSTSQNNKNPNYPGARPVESWGNPQQESRPQGGGRPSSRPGSQKRKRISERKCDEYSKEVTENITGLPLTTNPDPVTIPVRKCIAPQQLIVGGENTTLGEFPHMAAIGFRGENGNQIAWNCGGTLISDQYVVTAAHCAARSQRPVKVRLGEYNLVKNDDGAHPADYAIVEIITHPEYRPPSKYNDIALLKLSRKVTFFKHIRPACLYSEETLTVTRAIATGWGRLSYEGNTSEILQKVVLNIVDKKTCNQLYKVNIKTEALSKGIVDGQLCAGELSGGKDTCQGDSGGPLTITSTKCIHHLIGITSFGKSCALANSTGVYTRISAYLNWIESIVWPNE